MTEWEREIFFILRDGVRVRYCRGEPPPPYRYAVTLEVQIEGIWVEIALWDNAHEVNEHHEHEYTRTQGKQPPRVLEFGSANEAMAAAIEKATGQWRRILSRWNQSR